MSRTAAAKFYASEPRPIMFGQDRYVWMHESDTMNADSETLEAYIELAPFDLDQGNTLVDVFGIVPDMERQVGDVELYVYGIDHPRDEVVSEETLTISETDVIVDTRIAGRQIGMKYTSNSVGGDFRLGKMGAEISGAGKKRSSRST